MYDIQEGHKPMSDFTRDEFKRILVEEDRHNKRFQEYSLQIEANQ